MSSIVNIEVIKERLIKNIEKLPKSDIQEIFDFVEFLQTKRNRGETTSDKTQFDPEKDPILKIMGIADVEPFANKIDQELYGK